MKVIKRSGRAQAFNQEKITKAISQANTSLVPEDRVSNETIEEVSNQVTERLQGFDQIDVDNIHKIIEETLNSKNLVLLSSSYTDGRGKKKKKYNEIEEQALSLIEGNNDDLKGENANKNPVLNASVRDYLAGIVVKSLNNKIIPEDLILAHKK
jgi:ribonucleoside-triphosphate reductase